jgi:cyclohexa-1,5-dienecarbonyl-CoA hydratase
VGLIVERRAEICELRLDAAPGNIIDRDVCRAYTEAVSDHGKDPHLKAFLFTAAGKHFSYGASVEQHVKGEVESFLPAFHELFYALMDVGVPTVAAVQGMCLGGAFELAAYCNFLIAEKSSGFAVPEIQLGVLPPVACAILPWRMPGAVAEDLVLTGRRMMAEEAARLGLVTELCEEGELGGATERFLEKRIRPLSGVALRMTHRGVRAPFEKAVRAHIAELERTYLNELMASKDANEGIAAFLEKRKPAWTDT